jgi:hypothetical protein
MDKVGKTERRGRALVLGSEGEQIELGFGPEEAPVALGSMPSLMAELGSVPEHRRPRGYKAQEPPYPLVPMLLLLILGVLCGRRGYISIAEWAVSVGKEHPEVLDALGCPSSRRRRTPAAATLFRCVRDLNRRAFQGAVERWLGQVADVLGPQSRALEQLSGQIGLDGKAIRGASARRGSEESGETPGLYLVAAYAPALQVVLDQVETAGKGHELAAVEVLLGRLPLKGQVVTADALLTQRSVCTTILEGGGDYLLPVKENQPALLADIEAAFSPSGAPRLAGGRSTAPAG